MEEILFSSSCSNTNLPFQPLRCISGIYHISISSPCIYVHLVPLSVSMLIHSHFKFTNHFEGSDFLRASKDPESQILEPCRHTNPDEVWLAQCSTCFVMLHNAQATAGVTCFCSHVVLALAVKQQYPNFWM